MSYRVKLSAFEGPLDLLLHLIGRAKIEIKDIFISQITEQYLAYMEETGDLEPETASEFLQMAATLLYIKSRSILPRPAEADADENGLTPEEQLVARLNEYKRYKAISEQLRDMEAEALKITYKAPEELPEGELESGADAGLLLEAYRRILDRLSLRPEQSRQLVIKPDQLSVKRQSAAILARLAIMDSMSFEQLIGERPTREAVAVTFLSLLELLHAHRISVRQSGTFGHIHITLWKGEDDGTADGDDR